MTDDLNKRTWIVAVEAQQAGSPAKRWRISRKMQTGDFPVHLEVDMKTKPSELTGDSVRQWRFPTESRVVRLNLSGPWPPDLVALFAETKAIHFNLWTTSNDEPRIQVCLPNIRATSWVPPEARSTDTPMLTIATAKSAECKSMT